MPTPSLIDRYQSIIARCDYRLTGHSRQTMGEQLAEAARWAERYAVQDVYGRGELIESFEADIATMLDKPAAVFVVSGTKAQCIALRIWADRAGGNLYALFPYVLAARAASAHPA